MHNLSSELTEQLHSTDPGYVQAVANSAHLVVSRIDEMFAEMLKGDTDRLDKYMDVVLDDEDVLAALMNPDIAVLDQLATEVVPVIAETYKIDIGDVTTDIMILTDYYSMSSLLDNV